MEIPYYELIVGYHFLSEMTLKIILILYIKLHYKN